MNNFNSEGQTSKLTQQQYFAPQPQIMTTQQINDQVDQIINPYSTKHPSKLYRKPPYKFQPNHYVSINKLFSIGTILGIIGSIICIISVFLPHINTYFYSVVYDTDIDPTNWITGNPNSTYSYMLSDSGKYSWIGWAILGIALAVLICSIFLKYDFGIIKFISLGVICYLNYYTSTHNYFSKSDLSMAYGYYLMYVGVGILLISAIIILIANIKEHEIKKQVRRVTYGN